MIQIRRPNNQREINEAVELTCKAFPLSYFEAKSLKAAMIKFLPNEFTQKNFIIAVEKNRIIGVLRFYPRKIVLAGIKFDILGITDLCIDRIHIEDKLFGVQFYLKCCEMLRRTEYALALGSARRVMSNYYYRFGHIGCHSYCDCFIEKFKVCVDKLSTIKFIEVFNEQNIDRYEVFRLSTYSSEWGLIYRSKDYWRWIGFQAKELKKIRFFEIREGSGLVGYFVISGNRFVDYGITDNKFGLHVRAMISFLGEKISFSDLRLNLSPSNKIFRYLELSNISYSMRYVPDEGIIALGLNRKKLVEVFCKIMSNAKKEFCLDNANMKLSKTLRFGWKKGKLVPMFEVGHLKRKDEQVLLNSAFLGTYGPFSLLNYEGPRILPPTFFRVNDLDAI